MRRTLHIPLCWAMAVWVASYVANADVEPSEPPPTTIPQRAKTRVLVLSFESLSAEPAGDSARVKALARSLESDLSPTPTIECASTDKVAADATAAVELGRADGAHFIVWGTVQTIEDRVRVTGQVSNVETAELAGRFKLTGLLDDWFEIQDAAAEQAERRVRHGVARQVEPGDGDSSKERADQAAAAKEHGPLEVPANSAVLLRRPHRSERPAWAVPPTRAPEGVARRHDGTRLNSWYGPYGHSRYRFESRYRPYRAFRARFGGYTYRGLPGSDCDSYYGPVGLGRFQGPVPLRWFYH